MVCMTSCVLTIAFLFANVFVFMNMEKDKKIKDYVSALDVDSLIRYKKIEQERRNLYIQGMIGGLILSILFLFLFGLKWNRMGTLCVVGAITFTFSYFYYILIPKKDYMVVHLDTKKERETWLEVYKVMQKYYHLGFIFGIFAVIFFCNIWLKK